MQSSAVEALHQTYTLKGFASFSLNGRRTARNGEGVHVEQMSSQVLMRVTAFGQMDGHKRNQINIQFSIRTICD